MKRNLFILTILTLAVLFLAFFSGPTFATNGKNYPGAMGVAEDSSDIIYLETSDFNGWLRNTGNKTINVILPAIKDQQYGIHSGWVKVIDKNVGQDVRCGLNSTTRTGNTCYFKFSGYQSSVGYGTQAQKLTFGGLQSQTGDNHYYYDCFIPPVDIGESAIISYHVEEYN